MLGFSSMPRVVPLANLLACAVIAAVSCYRPAGAGFEVVRVSETAYLTPDAATAPDGGPEAGGSDRGNAVRKSVMPVNCAKAPAQQPNAGEESGDYPECMLYLYGRLSLDPTKTKRLREKMGREDVCCYSPPQYGRE